MKVIRVVNNVAPAGSVAIGRGSVWGNPFLIGADGDRDTVISKFYHYAKWRLEREPKWLEPLQGKDLACYCSPNPCHGNAIISLLAEADEQVISEDPEVQESFDEIETEACTACNGKTHMVLAVPNCNECTTAWGAHVPHFSAGMRSRGCRTHCTCDLCF